MVMIKRTKVETKKIEEFTKIYSTLFNVIMMKHPHVDLQKMFDGIKEKIYIPSGTLYLCFSCGAVLHKKDLTPQKFFQVKQRWHPCQNFYNGASLPSIGIFTQWNDVLKYLKTVDLDKLKNILSSYR